MIEIKHHGSFSKTDSFLMRASKHAYTRILGKYGQMGVEALASATPSDSGETANSWGYEITADHGDYSIIWTNSNINDGVPIAIILQLGHGTGTGGYVQGRDYINPALQPVFDQIAEKVWREVTR